MIVPDKVTFTSSIGKYEILDGVIHNTNDGDSRLDQLERRVLDYAPNDKNALFKKLVAVDYKTDSAILAFYNEYGSLDPQRIDDLESTQEETIDAASRAVFYFRKVFQLDVEITGNEPDRMERIRMLLSELFTFYKAQPRPGQYFSVEDFIGAVTNHADPYLDPHAGFDNIAEQNLIEYSKHITAGIINTHIKNVRPWFMYADGKRSCSWKLHGGLLSAIYFEYYLALCKNRLFRMCKNKTCPETIEIYGSDTRKYFCSNQCANTYSKRIIRANKKKHDLVNGEQVK